MGERRRIRIPSVRAREFRAWVVSLGGAVRAVVVRPVPEVAPTPVQVPEDDSNPRVALLGSEEAEERVEEAVQVAPSTGVDSDAIGTADAAPSPAPRLDRREGDRREGERRQSARGRRIDDIVAALAPHYGDTAATLKALQTMDVPTDAMVHVAMKLANTTTAEQHAEGVRVALQKYMPAEADEESTDGDVPSQ